jgi:hypothetical protein
MLACHGLEFVYCLRYVGMVTVFLFYCFLALAQVTVSESRQMAALLVGLKAVLYMMARLKAYMDYLQYLPPTVTRTNFENSLTELHALILQFLATAIQTYQKSAATRSGRGWRSRPAIVIVL